MCLCHESDCRARNPLFADFPSLRSDNFYSTASIRETHRYGAAGKTTASENVLRLAMRVSWLQTPYQCSHMIHTPTHTNCLFMRGHDGLSSWDTRLLPWQPISILVHWNHGNCLRLCGLRTVADRPLFALKTEPNSFCLDSCNSERRKEKLPSSCFVFLLKQTDRQTIEASNLAQNFAWLKVKGPHEVATSNPGGEGPVRETFRYGEKGGWYF